VERGGPEVLPADRAGEGVDEEDENGAGGCPPPWLLIMLLILPSDLVCEEDFPNSKRIDSGPLFHNFLGFVTLECPSGEAKTLLEGPGLLACGDRLLPGSEPVTGCNEGRPDRGAVLALK
jgi:hypothetical protein